MNNNNLQKMKSEMDNLTSDLKSWEPRTEESLIGLVNVIGSMRTKFSDNSRYVEIEDAESGELRRIWMNAVLEDEMEKNNVNIKDLIGVKFMGMRNTRDGNRQYKNFRVKVFSRDNGNDDSDEKTEQIPF